MSARILWLISDRMGCGTYRALVPALTLQDSKVADSEFLLHDECKRHRHDSFDDAGVVVFQRAVGDTFVEWIKACRKLGIRTVFEMDDDLFHVAKHSPAGAHWNQKSIQRQLRAELDLVDHVICSTRPLQEMVQQEMGWKSPSKMTVCHNHLHRAIWGNEILNSVMPYPNQKIVIGWQGSTTHDVDFKEALPALRRVLDEHPHTVLRLFGSLPLSMQGVIPEERFQWAKGVPFERYPTTLRFVNFDIGIAPVTNSNFNRGKSNLKWLEYSALGIPCVASKVYPYARSIEHGVTGYLATTADEWYAALTPLVEDAELRQRIGAQARQHVWQQWGAAAHAPFWTEALALPVMEVQWQTA